MTNEQIEIELQHVATKESLVDFKADLHTEFGNFKSEMHKEFGNFKTDITKTLWLSQLSMAGILVALVGLLNGATFFFINQTVGDIKSDIRELSRSHPSHSSENTTVNPPPKQQ